MSKGTDNSVGFGIGVLFGVIFGVAAGVLLAPKSGEETREEIKNVACNLKGNTQPEIDVTKRKSIDMINKIKFTLENQFVKVNDAIKAGKMAAAKRKEELETGAMY